MSRPITRTFDIFILSSVWISVLIRGARTRKASAHKARARRKYVSAITEWVLNKSIQMTPRPDWNRIMQRLLRAQRALVTDALHTRYPAP